MRMKMLAKEKPQTPLGTAVPNLSRKMLNTMLIANPINQTCLIMCPKHKTARHGTVSGVAAV